MAPAPAASLETSPPKPTANHLAITMPTNNYHLTGVNGYGAASVHAQQAANANLQTLHAHMAANNLVGSRPAAYMGHVNVSSAAGYTVPSMAPNMNLKLPASRQMQWAASQPGVGVGLGVGAGLGVGVGVNGVSIARSASAGSPPRPSQSPSLQHQAVVNGTQGY